VVLAVALAACGAGATAPVPPDIDWGRDICLECGMILSDPRFVGAYEYRGDDRFFDDIGDMIAYGVRTGELSSSTPAWVHDFRSGIWIDAASAHYVAAERLVTPMGHGLAALADPAQAEALAQEFGGAVLTWDDLLVRPPFGETSRQYEG
jgi:copper chaperone NosL